MSIIGAAATTGLLAPPAWAEAVRRIGVLMGMDAGDPAGQSEVTALKQGLQELGWVEGRNLQVEYYWPGGEPIASEPRRRSLLREDPMSLSHAPLQLWPRCSRKRGSSRSFSPMSSIP